ncbi:hypothetical protein C6496_02555 [Candidatus Poribacteria bacterium]|nr:MAG: hypothetical protein C6496_02555 [Candidatus Poribacteria bacterium]
MKRLFCFVLCVLTLIMLEITLVYTVFASPGTEKIAFTSTRDGNSEIYIMNPDGSQQQNLTWHSARDLAPAWSPTGQHIAFNSDRDGIRDIYLMDADGKNVRKVFRSSAYREYPAWSPDGKKLAYLRAEDWSIYVATVDGEQVERIAPTNSRGGWPAWSPDGSEIVFVSTDVTGYLLKAVNLQTRKVRVLLPNDEPKTIWDPAWSPDGALIAFHWYKKGIYTIRKSGRGLKLLVRNASRPAWSPSGDELIYGKDKQLFKFDLSNRRAKQLTHGAINFGADWSEVKPLSVEPQASQLTTKWAIIKQR